MNVVYTAALRGLEAERVEVTCTRRRGLPRYSTSLWGLSIHGLTEIARREAGARVLSALRTLGGAALPEALPEGYNLEVSLHPIELVKDPAAYDLAIAIAILAELGVVPSPEGRPLFLGELSLSGDLRPVRGLMALAAPHGHSFPTTAFIPWAQWAETTSHPGVIAFGAKTLGDVVDHLNGRRVCPSPAAARIGRPSVPPLDDLPDGLWRRALEAAAAGGHSIIFVGPPGSGATMHARRLPGLLPPMKPEEAYMVTLIRSVAGLLSPGEGLATSRPFRAPHHTVSDAGLLGGGNPPRPGEVTLAHHGVLFLDEIAEFRAHTLNALKQVLKEGRADVLRYGEVISFPARPLLVASTFGCPCGYVHAPPGSHPCTCSEASRKAYLNRIPWDLFDIVADTTKWELRKVKQ